MYAVIKCPSEHAVGPLEVPNDNIEFIIARQGCCEICGNPNITAEETD